MIQFKRLISICLLMLIVVIASAQSGSNSPYTRYGYGQLSDQNFGNSKAMGGIAYGLRNGLQINAANPASYSAVDSLTFIFDAGLSLQNANFKDSNAQTNAKNSSLDYIAMQFRLCKGLGFAAGFLPYSTVGYDISNSKKIGSDEFGNTISSTSRFSGDGSLHQVFVGLGYNVFKNLSVGANISYLHGVIKHSATTQFNSTDVTSSVRSDKISINDYKLDLGVQYSQAFGEKHLVNVGAVYSYGHDIYGKSYLYNETYASGSSIPTTQKIDTIRSGYGLPHSFGLGATYVYDNRLTVGLDYTYQKWGEVEFMGQKGQFSNRQKIAVGAEYIPDPYKRNYLSRIRYRVGAYYSDPYAKINNQEGSREYGLSFGFGLPIFQSRSLLNISGQYIKVSPKVSGMLEENYLRINIGLTFNERWFMKWRVN